MCHLFETLRIENGAIINANYHLARMNRSRLELGISSIPLTNFAPFKVDGSLARGKTYRCRIDYSINIQSVTISEFDNKPIRTLKLVDVNQLSYPHKFADRSILEFYRKQFPNFDDVLFIVNGLITDTSIGNIVFSDGTNFVTPKSPLLNGTQRSYLLDHKIIDEANFTVADLHNYTSWTVINALRPLQPTQLNAVGQIHF